MIVPVPGCTQDPSVTSGRYHQQSRKPVTATLYRDLMSSFPTGVAVITSFDQHGRPHGMTCTSLSSVTLTPPTLLVCLNRRSGTLDAVQTYGSFAINLLHSRARRVAEIFSGPVPDRFSQVRWRLSNVAGLPWLFEDAFALAECTVRKSSIVGDHEVVLGEVCEVVLHGSDVPLLYGMRQFSTWLPDRVEEVTAT
ncbi:MAG: flavin reductase family protein [Egibacteraceae bacterium]